MARLAAAVFVALHGVCFSVVSSAQEGAALKVPAGYCPLEVSKSEDRFVLDYWERTFAQGDRLILGSVQCDQLSSWRKPPMVLNEFTQILMIQAKSLDSIPVDRRLSWPQGLCNLARKSTNQSATEPRAEFNARFIDMLKLLQKVGDQALIGVIAQESDACHQVVIARAQSVSGKPISIIHVRATILINEMIYHFVHTAHVEVGRESAALDKIAELSLASARLNRSAQ